MTVEITSIPKRTVVKAIRMTWQPYEERAEFEIVPEKGRKTLFHWLNEPRSGELDECQTAIKRLCETLGIPFEYAEK